MTDNTNATESTASKSLDATIAPAKTKADKQDTIYYLERLFVGAYPPGTTLQYHDYELTHTSEGVWSVQHRDDANPIDVLNPDAFRSATELHTYLDDLANHAPDSREEWRTHRTRGENR